MAETTKLTCASSSVKSPSCLSALKVSMCSWPKLWRQKLKEVKNGLRIQTRNLYEDTRFYFSYEGKLVASPVWYPTSFPRYFLFLTLLRERDAKKGDPGNEVGMESCTEHPHLA